MLDNYSTLNYLNRLIASGWIIEFKLDIRFKLGRINSKSWNQIVNSIPNVGIDNSIRFLELKSKPDPKKPTQIVKTIIFNKFNYF